MITPFDDFVYLVNNVLLGEEPVGEFEDIRVKHFLTDCFHFQTIEDFILLVGTVVAFVAFVLWCCFPVVPKESQAPMHYESKDYQVKYNQRKIEYCSN